MYSDLLDFQSLETSEVLPRTRRSRFSSRQVRKAAVLIFEVAREMPFRRSAMSGIMACSAMSISSFWFSRSGVLISG